MRKAFEKLDRDHSGSLSFNEFAQECKKHEIPERLSNSLRTLFLLLDDPDSSAGLRNAVVTVEEFCVLDNWRIPRFLLETPNFSHQEPFKQALFKRSDFNPLLAWRKFLDKDG